MIRSTLTRCLLIVALCTVVLFTLPRTLHAAHNPNHRGASVVTVATPQAARTTQDSGATRATVLAPLQRVTGHISASRHARHHVKHHHRHHRTHHRTHHHRKYHRKYHRHHRRKP